MNRKKIFLERWKEKEERKRKQKTAEEGWKNLMQSISDWEEMTLEDISEEEPPEMTMMTEEGFRAAGSILEGIMEEVLAFKELEEKFGGAVTPNNQLHLNLDAPPDRQAEQEGIMLEITRIKEILEQNLEERKEKEKGIRKDTEVGTVPPSLGLKRSTKKEKGKTSIEKGKREKLELVGENEGLRKQRRAMNKMFMTGKLKREEKGKVPPIPLSLINGQTSQTGRKLPDEKLGGLPRGEGGESAKKCEVFESMSSKPKVTQACRNPKSKVGNLKSFWENKGGTVPNDVTKPRFCGPNRSGTVPEKIVAANQKCLEGSRK